MNYLSAASLMRVVSVKQMHSKRSMDGASHQPDVALKASPPSDINQPSQEGPSGSLRMAALGLDGRARVALSRVCTHTKTVLDLNDAPETLLYRQARSAVVGAERAVLIGPVRGLQWSKM